MNMATMNDVLAEFHQYHSDLRAHVSRQDDSTFCTEAAQAYEDLQRGSCQRARQLLDSWIAHSAARLPDLETPTKPPERTITLEDVESAAPGVRDKLNHARLLQLRSVLD